MGLLRWARNLDDAVREQAYNRLQPGKGGIGDKIATAQQQRLGSRTEELAARPAEAQAAYIASILNRGGSNASDFADALDFDNYEAIRRAMGQNVNPATVQPDELTGRVKGLNSLQSEGLARAMAGMEGRGMRERLGLGEQKLNQALAESQAARLGLYGAIGTGSVMGLTAAGQGVAALTQYMQSGLEQQAEREAPLT